MSKYRTRTAQDLEVDCVRMLSKVETAGRVSLAAMAFGIGIGLATLGQYGLETFIVGVIVFISAMITMRQGQKMVDKRAAEFAVRNYQCTCCHCDGMWCDECMGLGRVNIIQLENQLAKAEKEHGIQVTKELIEGYRITWN